MAMITFQDHEFLRERKLPHDKIKQSRRDEMLLQIQSSLDLLCGRDMCAEIAFIFHHQNTAGEYRFISAERLFDVVVVTLASS